MKEFSRYRFVARFQRDDGHGEDGPEEETSVEVCLPAMTSLQMNVALNYWWEDEFLPVNPDVSNLVDCDATIVKVNVSEPSRSELSRRIGLFVKEKFSLREDWI